MKKITFLTFLLAFAYTAMGQQPTTTPPMPPHASGDVISLFSDTYTSTATLNLASFTPAGNTISTVNAAGNDVYELVITGGEFHGFNLSSAIDLGLMENLHYDIWIAGTTQPGAVFNTTLSQHNGGHLSGQTAGYVDTNALAPGQEGTWLSFDIALDETEFSGLSAAARKDIISQIVFTHTNLSNTGPIYVDNVYFWRQFVDPNTDATLADLTVGGTTVEGFASSILTYSVELPNGTATAPTVAGLATEDGNGSSAVSVTQASSVPGTATLDVTAPNGTTMLTYTVNFTEGVAIPPAAPTPPSVPAISLISDVFTNINVPQVDVFGGILSNVDLNADGNDEARTLTGGSGFQFNWFPNSAFIDISQAGFLHVDFYADGITNNDLLKIRLIGSNTAIQNIAAIDLQASDSGSWVSLDLALPEGANLNDFGSPGSAGTSIDLTDLALIQINTLDDGSTLPSKLIYLSNIYFYGGTLSTPEVNLANSFRAFPNPTNGDWNISGNSVINNVAVFNVLGKQVINLTPYSNEVAIDASTLKSGIYFARIEGQNGTSTIKLVKE